MSFYLNFSLKTINRTSDFSLKMSDSQLRKHTRILTVFGSSDKQLRSTKATFIAFLINR